MGDSVSTDFDYDTNDPDVKAALLLKIAEEIRHESAQADEKEAQADFAALNLRAGLRGEQRYLATDQFHHVYRFADPIADYTVEAAMDTLSFWDRTEPEVPIEIMFNSPGGSVFAGMDLFDFIQELRRKGHHVTTSARGMAASMAGILLQAGDHRVMGREAQVLIHEVSSIAVGKIGEIEDEVLLIHKMQDRVIKIFADRAAAAGENGTASDPITAARLKRGWSRKDWWLDSDECLKYGLVDEIR